MLESPHPERITWAVERMPLAPDARVLEIGCGGSHALELLAARVPAGTVIGIDRSAQQVALARARLHTIHTDRRPRVEPMTLAAAAVHWRGEPFDHVLAVNVNAFWTDASDSLAHLAALLAPRGHAHLVFEPPSAAGIAKIRDALLLALARHALVAHAVEEVAFSRSRALLFVLRHGDRRR